MGFLPPYPLPSNLRALLPSTCKYNTRPLRHMINRMVQNWELNLQILDLREQQIEGPSWIYWFWHDIPKLSTGYYWACRISYNIIKFNIFKPCLYLFMLQPGLNHANGKHHGTTCKSRYPSIPPKLANMGFQTLHPFCPRVYLDPF